MIHINIDNLIFDKNFLDIKYKHKIKESLSSIMFDRETQKIGFMDLDINNEVSKIKKFVTEKKKKFKNILILGIGGSALGTAAILEAIKGKYHQNDEYKVFILDSIDPFEVNSLVNNLNLEETLLMFISKSGSTIETVTQYIYFRDIYQDRFPENWKEKICFIIGENSPLVARIRQEKFDYFTIPQNIGGRFSVFSNVGLIPLCFAGVDIDELLAGITAAKKYVFSENLSENPALLISLIQYHSYLELGKNITVFFPYITNFVTLGKWYKQMIGESLGKGGAGVLISDCVGVTDQHSQLQLYYDGPNDKLVIFVEAEDHGGDIKVGDAKNYTFQNLMKVEKYGTEKSLTEYNKINYTIKIKDFKERSVGEFIFLLEMQTAMLGQFYGVDAYDQPGVERGKEIAREKLSENISLVELMEKLF